MFGQLGHELSPKQEEQMSPSRLALFFSDNNLMADEVRIYMNIMAAISSGFNTTTGNGEEAKKLAESKERIGQMIAGSGKNLNRNVEDFITEVVYRISN